MKTAAFIRPNRLVVNPTLPRQTGSIIDKNAIAVCYQVVIDLLPGVLDCYPLS
jgi:hypothetical protein